MRTLAQDLIAMMSEYAPNPEDEVFFIEVDDGDHTGVVRLYKEGNAWKEEIESGNLPNIGGKTYQSYMKPADILKWFKGDFDRAEFYDMDYGESHDNHIAIATEILADISKDEGLRDGKLQFHVVNNSGDYSLSFKADTVEQAKSKIQAMMANDGSYWEEDRWRQISDDEGNVVAELENK